jgi:hypothetical protein
VSDPARVDDVGDVVDGSARASLGDADMGVVWVSGADRALWFRAVDVSTAPGSKAARRLSAPGDRAAEPDLEAAGPAFAAAWSDGAGGVYGAWSADGGASFVELPRVERTSKIAMPRVAISGTAAYRVWLDRSARLVYRRDVANATAPAIVGTLGRRAVFPDVSAAGEVVCVVWQTRSGRAARLFSRVSGDAGATFGPAAALSDRGEFAAAARASAGDGRAAAVWQMPVAGRQDVFFASLAP